VAPWLKWLIVCGLVFCYDLVKVLAAILVQGGTVSALRDAWYAFCDPEGDVTMIAVHSSIGTEHGEHRGTTWKLPSRQGNSAQSASMNMRPCRR